MVNRADGVAQDLMNDFTFYNYTLIFVLNNYILSVEMVISYYIIMSFYFTDKISIVIFFFLVWIISYWNGCFFN